MSFCLIIVIEIIQGIMDYVHEKINPHWKPPSAPVMVLTSENFTQVVRDTEFLLVEFFTPWCQHCQQVVTWIIYQETF